jgi:hypothetical protein
VALPSKPTLTSSGTTSFVDGTDILAADVQAYFDPLYNGFSNLDDTNIAAAANVDPSKVGDYSATATQQKAVTDPGSGSSLSAATDATGELERLRFAIERVALGISGTSHAVRYDGSSNVNVGWMDLPHRYGNLLYNPDFALKTTGATSAPEGWALTATPTNCALATAVVGEGAGKILNLKADAANEGIQQTVAGLKASTRYLCVARMRVNSGTGSLIISGADSASQFRPVTVSSTSATFQTVKAVVQTDSTPTSLVFSVVAAANGNDVDVSHVGLYECSADALYPVSAVRVRTTDTTNTASKFPSGSLSAAILSTAIIPPTYGYQIRVRAKVDALNETAGERTAVFILYENGVEVDCVRRAANASSNDCFHMEYLNAAPTAGTTYTYTVKGGAISGTFAMNGAATALAETPRCSLVLEMEKA